MCGTFGQKQLPYKKAKPIQISFLPEKELKPIPEQNKHLNLNTWTGRYAGILLSEKPDEYVWGQFGFTPVWAKKKMYLFNARVEGDFNKENDPNYDGEKGLFKKPSFRNAIKKRRCVIPMDFFVEGPEKEKYSKPFLIHRKDSEVFFAGGVYEDWIDKDTGEVTTTFSILTTAATSLLQKVGHHRSSLLLEPDFIPAWLNTLEDLDFIKTILKPANTKEFEAYPINAGIVKSKENDPNIEKPLGAVLRVVH